MSMKSIYNEAHISDQGLSSQTDVIDIFIMIYCRLQRFLLCNQIPMVLIYFPSMICISAIIHFFLYRFILYKEIVVGQHNIILLFLWLGEQQ